MKTSFDTLITIEELHLLEAKHPIWVDCRFYLSDKEKGRKEYLVAHVSGAHYAHLDDDLSGTIVPGETGRHPLPLVDKLRRLVGGWGLVDGSQQVIIYDQGPGGVAARVWWMLQWIGHEKCAVLDGGWRAYEASKLPTSTDEPLKSDNVYGDTIRSGWIWDAERVARSIDSESDVLIDSRDAPRYQGLIEPIDPVAGHIEGAINMPFKENLVSDGVHWKKKSELRERFAQLESTDSAHIGFYCGSGVTACHNILALKHATGKMAKLYPGSWSEWLIEHG